MNKKIWTVFILLFLVTPAFAVENISLETLPAVSTKEANDFGFTVTGNGQLIA